MNCCIGMRKPEKQPKDNYRNILVNVAIKDYHYVGDMCRKPANGEHGNCHEQHLNDCIALLLLPGIRFLIDSSRWSLFPQEVCAWRVQDRHYKKWYCISEDDFTDHICFLENLCELFVFVPFSGTLGRFTFFLYQFMFVKFPTKKTSLQATTRWP